jgi:hypothetical protein
MWLLSAAQWGDERKGKIVDYLANEAQIIVRFSGGASTPPGGFSTMIILKNLICGI